MNINDLKVLQRANSKIEVILDIVDRHGFASVGVHVAFDSGAELMLDIPTTTPVVKVLNMLADADIVFRLSTAIPFAVLARYGLNAGSPQAEPEQHPKKCDICNKRMFKTPQNCKNFAHQGKHWQCQLNSKFVGSAPVSPLVWRNGGLA